MPATAPPRRIRRLGDRQVVDRPALHRLLDEQLVGHLSAVVDGAPVVIPMAYARDGEALLVHGSTGGGFALRAAASGSPVAFAVTALDGMVVARTLFDHSMNYRSAVVYGCLEPVDDDEAALLALSERLLPGRTAEVRGNTRKERAATRVLRLALDDVVMKVRAGGPGDEPEQPDEPPQWTGVVPLAARWGEPVAAEGTPPGVPVPASVRALAGG
ncbi:pyridoxamine 5'-phosphate oxidase family protein [Agromyces sp. SYSU T00194]|uniref:pyridoxamine 5'-phosphate oxidase family protein n=1 Tax=Agromyces chitinivorans TaxID=3158560 RepID=UPI0033988229